MTDIALLDDIDVFGLESGTLADNATLECYATLSRLCPRPDTPVSHLPTDLDTTIDSNEIVSSWVDKVVADLNQLAKLPVNWDSYGSPRIPQQLIKVVKLFLYNFEYETLPPPFVVPVSGGGIQIEWRVNNRELEIEFTNTRNVSYLQLIDNNPIAEGEFEIGDVKTPLRSFRWLISA